MDFGYLKGIGMRLVAVLAMALALAGCAEWEQFKLSVLGTPAGLAGCEQPNDIVAVTAVANNPNYVIYEVDYCYDGGFGEDVRINLAPATQDAFVPHAPVQALAGRNQVTLTLVAQNFNDDHDTKALSHLEVSMDLLVVTDEGQDSRKLLSEVVSLSAILHRNIAPQLPEATSSNNGTNSVTN